MLTFRRASRATGQSPPSPPGAEPETSRHAAGRRAPGRWHRWTAFFTATGALTACALAACALFTPVTVFGAQLIPDPGPEQVGKADPTATVPPQPAETTSGAVDAAAGTSLVAASYSAAATPSSGTLLVTLPWGSGPGQVGLTQPTEGLTRGPEALAVSPNGRIAVLDSVNRRVLFLDSQGQVTGSAFVKLQEPRFLAVTDGRVYVLDCDSSRKLVMMSWTGSYCCIASLPSLPDVVTGLFATANGPCVEVAHDQVFRVGGIMGIKSKGDISDADPVVVDSDPSLADMAGRPVDTGCFEAVKLTFAPASSPVALASIDDGTNTTIRTSSLDLAVPSGRSIEHLLSVDGDTAGNVVVGARLLDADSSETQALLVLRRFALGADGRLVPASQTTGQNDSLLLLDQSCAYVGQPYVVAPDGRIFQPVATDTGYQILIHSFDATPVAAWTTGRAEEV